MKKQLIIACCLLMGAAQWAAADTVGYWRFEDGPGPVTKPYGAIDSSGNGYHMDPWTAGDWAGFEYRTDVAGSVLEVDGVYLPNQYSIKNTGGSPAMATEPGAGIQSITPAAFTIEATFKLENDGHKTVVGRDSQGSVTQGENPNADLAALYFQTVPNNGLAIKFCDVSGYWHEAISAENVYIGFDFSSNPDGLNTPWYSMAGVSDGQTLSLYLRNVTAGEDWRLIAQTDLTASGSPNTALTAGTGQGSDWYAGSWSIGRGLYAGGHTDRGYGFIDEVRISDAALSPQEFIFVDSRLGAWNPSPADGAANVGVSPDGQTVTVELSWNTGIDPDNPSQLNATILSHSLYMSPDQTKTEDPNLYWVADFPVEGPTAQTTIEQLYFDGLYYWRVDEGIDDGTGNPYPAGDPNNITGRVWTFETRVSRPVFILQPISQVVDAGDTVELAVEAESISAVQYRWYKSADNVADPENDVAITDLGDYAILVLEDVQVADEGYYYCQAVNQAGIDRAAYSDVVTVGIRRKVAHWTMDQADYVGGQYLDISGEGHHADPNGTPTFVEGQLGEAVAIYREFGDPPSTDSWARAGHWNPSEFSGQLTVSFWLKWAGLNGTWQSLISKRSGDFNNENALWQICTDNGLPHLWFQSPRSLIAVNNGLVPDQWLHIVVTFDGTDGTIYINGEQRAKGGFQFGDAVEAAICLGGNSFDVGPREWVNGDLDDVQFFNYALSDLDIAVMYNAITGEDVCVQSQRPDAQFDLNDDCIVDIQDFAILVQNWLECGLISCAD